MKKINTSNPKDFSSHGKAKRLEMCTMLDNLQSTDDIIPFVTNWKQDFLCKVNDEFISSKVDEICEKLMYFLYAGDESGTIIDLNRVYYFNFNIEDDLLWFSFYK